MEFDIIAFIILFVLLALSTFFSACETAFTSLNRIRLKSIAEKGTGKTAEKAKQTLDLYNDFDRLLSSLLVGNNVANLSAASLCAVLFVRRFGDMGATLSTAVLTIVVIIFAEVSPKIIAKKSPEKIAISCTPFIRFIMFLLTPANHFFIWWKNILYRLFRPETESQTITEAEIHSYVDEAQHEGAIGNDDRLLLHNALEFYDQQANDILTHRMDIIGIPKNATPEEIASIFLQSGRSRLPVYDGNIDNITGIVHMRDFFRYTMNKDRPLHSIISPAVFVANITSVSELIKILQREKSHMAIVSDEYGGTEGLVTMEDILEELVGEIWDESDNVEEQIVLLGNNSYRVLCTTHMDDLYEYFNLTHEHNHAPTVSVWIRNKLGKIPVEGDSFGYDDITVTVSKTNHRRAAECIIVKNVETEQPG
ncbi:MAG: hemolysin family protein [Firmicutes bacterium]|nr:hemolysin family protein [Bacillota bacterium]